MIESQIQSAQAALERDDLDAAGIELAKARNTDATDARVVDLAFRVCKAMKQKIGSSIDDGSAGPGRIAAWQADGAGRSERGVAAPQAVDRTIQARVGSDRLWPAEASR
jgi:hypothetical protein